MYWYAVVSDVHANFIVNEGEQLQRCHFANEKVQRRVNEEHQFNLELSRRQKMEGSIS